MLKPIFLTNSKSRLKSGHSLKNIWCLWSRFKSEKRKKYKFKFARSLFSDGTKYFFWIESMSMNPEELLQGTKTEEPNTQRPNSLSTYRGYTCPRSTWRFCNWYERVILKDSFRCILSAEVGHMMHSCTMSKIQ